MIEYFFRENWWYEVWIGCVGDVGRVKLGRGDEMVGIYCVYVWDF